LITPSTRKLEIISALFVAAIVVSNVIASKLVQIGPLVVPGGFFLYAVTFLATDIVSEVWGKREAGKLVILGFIAAVFSALAIKLTQWLPVAGFAAATGEAYDVILGANIRIVGASMVAYLASQFWDINVFHRVGKLTGGKHKWLRNNLSTMSSQAIDTVLFVSIAFAGVVPHLWTIIVSQYVVKLIVAAIDTPIFYLLTRRVSNPEFAKA
jgi:hypothetical protein